MPRIAKKLDLAPPDYDKIRNDATTAVEADMSKLKRADDRLELAAEIVRQADAEIAAHVDDRNLCLASLYLQGHYEGVQLGHIAGITKNAVHQILSLVIYGDSRRPLPPRMTEEEMTRLATEHGIPKEIPDAGEQLRSAGQVIEAARARRKAAVRWMQDATLVLSEAGHENAAIAKLAGVSRKVTWQHIEAARKRRGY
jgi:hypothetical protein